jgi:hypothetical protein
MSGRFVSDAFGRHQGCVAFLPRAMPREMVDFMYAEMIVEIINVQQSTISRG